MFPPGRVGCPTQAAANQWLTPIVPGKSVEVQRIGDELSEIDTHLPSDLAYWFFLAEEVDMIPVNSDVPIWKRLCSTTSLTPEVISLAEAIFMNKGEIKVVCNLHGDDAQSFIDATHKVRFVHPALGYNLIIFCSCYSLTPKPLTYAV